MINLKEIINNDRLKTALTAVKNYVDGRISALASSVSDVMEDVNTSITDLETGKADSGHKHTNYASTVNTTGSGNAITGISQSGNTITATKGSTFLTEHPKITLSDDTSSNVSPGHGGTFTVVSAVTRDTNGHVSKINTSTITLPADKNTQYSQATSSALGLVKIGFPESGKNYPVELNDDGQMFVNVPWTDNNTVYTHPTTSGNKHIPSGGSSGQILRWSADGTAVWGNDNNTTYSQATSSTLGLVKIGYTESGKNYPVELDSDGKMFVNVPWTDNNTTYSAATSSALGLVKIGSNITNSSGTISLTKANVTAALGYTPPTTNTTYSQATSSTLGLVKIGYSENGKNYPVELNDDGQMFVNVPWTDTDTNTDTKNTAGSTNTSSKIFLIGATSQASNPQTYSHDTVYIGTDGCVYSGSKKTATVDQLLKFSDVSVATSAWAADTTYSDFPYRASVTCSGVTADHVADVVFGIAEAHGGNFGPLCQTASNVVYIYAKAAPTAAITIPTIEARKAV